MRLNGKPSSFDLVDLVFAMEIGFPNAKLAFQWQFQIHSQVALI